MACHRLKLLAAVALVVSASGADAALAAGCVPERTALAPSVLAGYRSNPADLLRDSGRSVGTASSRVRNAVASDSEMLGALGPAIKSAVGDDARSIGLGLGSAAQICARGLPAVAQSIQRAVEESGNPAVQQAFASVIGDQPVLSTGASGAGGFASGSGTLGGGPHRPTETPTYGFSSGSPQVPSGGFLSGGSSSSTPRAALGSSSSGFVSTFQSVSGVRPN